ncbi:MAG TPA: cyclic nucleotide-binding domain-containing protein [Candidatus Limiplasma sp.]|nr:cyclic nucleotide-binding domain-containing protein [Candidatus Limiplasma sp.]HPR78825.1 cyclic nucleotide-binding domain-containing protein [Candidatus Limiplasma sp.]
MSYPDEKRAEDGDALVKTLLRRYGEALPPLEGYPLKARRFVAGEMLAQPGEPLQNLCFLVEGCATVYNAMENGRAAMLTEYRGVQTIGELELLMEGPVLTGSIQAGTSGAMLYLPLEPSRERLFHDAAILRYLGREVARKLEHSSRLSAQDRLYPLSARLAAYLLYRQSVPEAEPRLTMPLTRLCELMGTSYRHLLRTLREFCENGYLVRENGGYLIADEEALKRLAGSIRYD